MNFGLKNCSDLLSQSTKAIVHSAGTNFVIVQQEGFWFKSKNIDFKLQITSSQRSRYTIKTIYTSYGNFPVIKQRENNRRQFC